MLSLSFIFSKKGVSKRVIGFYVYNEGCLNHNFVFSIFAFSNTVYPNKLSSPHAFNSFQSYLSSLVRGMDL